VAASRIDENTLPIYRNPTGYRNATGALMALGQKIEAVEGIVPVRLSLVARCAAIGLRQLRIADLPIFVLGCCDYTRKNRRSLRGAFEPRRNLLHMIADEGLPGLQWPIWPRHPHSSDQVAHHIAGSRSPGLPGKLAQARPASLR
jgi:hypothetical protein